MVCRVPGEIKGAWLDDGGNGEDTALLRRAVAVLGVIGLLRNFCDDEELFFRWMRFSLKSRKAEMLDASVEYLFSWLKPDREQFVHGRWISDIKSVTYGCIPLDRNAGAAVSRPCLFTVTSRKNGSSCLLEIRSAALNGAFIAVEMPPDNRTLHPGELLPFRIGKTVTDGLVPGTCGPCGCRPWRFLKMCLHRSFPPSPKIFVPVRRKICCLNWNHGQEAVNDSLCRRLRHEQKRGAGWKAAVIHDRRFSWNDSKLMIYSPHESL